MKTNIKFNNKVFITICKETIVREFYPMCTREYIKDKKYYYWYEDAPHIWVVSINVDSIKNEDLTQLCGSRFSESTFQTNFLTQSEIRKEKIKKLNEY